MKTFLTIILCVIFSAKGYSQVANTSAAKPDANKKLLTVDASCGECNFDMEGKSCDLAVRINGKAYFVDGVSISAYGHPHDKHGFCVAVRKAEVQGDTINGRFKATYFKLLDVQETKNLKMNK